MEKYPITNAYTFNNQLDGYVVNWLGVVLTIVTWPFTLVVKMMIELPQREVGLASHQMVSNPLLQVMYH